MLLLLEFANPFSPYCWMIYLLSLERLCTLTCFNAVPLPLLFCETVVIEILTDNIAIRWQTIWLCTDFVMFMMWICCLFTRCLVLLVSLVKPYSMHHVYGIRTIQYSFFHFLVIYASFWLLRSWNKSFFLEIEGNSSAQLIYQKLLSSGCFFIVSDILSLGNGRMSILLYDAVYGSFLTWTMAPASLFTLC